jgi:hypothetical protein
VLRKLLLVLYGHRFKFICADHFDFQTFNTKGQMMTIALECINLIIPIALIEKKHPGGWQAFLTENPGLPSDYYDQHLLRLGAMDSLGILFLIEDWKKKGFKPYKTVDGIKHWKDMCVVDTFSGPTLPCTWLQFDADRGTASLAGSDRQSNLSLPPAIK